MDFEKLLILLIFGLIALVRWLLVDGGLKRLLGKFETDLNAPFDEDLKRSAPPPLRRQIPTTRPVSANPEEERLRKFMEALGLPADAAPHSPPARRPAQYPVPPIIAQPPRLDHQAAERVRRERAERLRLERQRAEEKFAAERALPPSVGKNEPTEEDQSVSRYFQMENFDRQQISMENIPELAPNASLGTEDFFNPLTEQKTLPAEKVRKLFGSPQNLRHWIVMSEILGRPKSLQNS